MSGGQTNQLTSLHACCVAENICTEHLKTSSLNIIWGVAELSNINIMSADRVVRVKLERKRMVKLMELGLFHLIKNEKHTLGTVL